MLVIVGVSLSVLFGHHGCIGWAATAAIVVLLVLVSWSRVLAHRMSLRKSEEVMRSNARHIRELTSLQGALAHELNTPLTAVKALAGLVELDPDQGPARLERLQAAIVRMQSLIEEHLSFSRPLTPLMLETTDLRELARDVVDLVHVLAAAQKIEVQLQAELPLEVVCDRYKIKQTVMGLLQNAIDASPEGERIVVRLTSLADEAVRLSVLDNGPGVPPWELPRIVEAGVSTKPGGSGLGLTLARAVAQQHGGTLVVENRDGKGFAAHVQLPRRASAA